MGQNNYKIIRKHFELNNSKSIAHYNSCNSAKSYLEGNLYV